MIGLSTRDGLVYHLDKDKRPKGGGLSPSMFSWNRLRGESDIPVILIHGFGYDPWKNNDNNPHFVGPLGEASTFGIWNRDLVPDRSVIGLGWYSVPPGFINLGKSLWNGRWNRYRYAWDLAWEVGTVLSVMLRHLDGPVDILCHSLGSRVALAALAQERDLPIRNMVLMNGAEFAKPARIQAMENKDINFVNLVVKADEVLAKLDTNFAPVSGEGPPIGLEGLEGASPENWSDILLDDSDVQAWGASRGWHLQGDNPKKYADHWFTYRHEGNHGLIRAALVGEI